MVDRGDLNGDMKTHVNKKTQGNESSGKLGERTVSRVLWTDSRYESDNEILHDPKTNNSSKTKLNSFGKYNNYVQFKLIF